MSTPVAGAGGGAISPNIFENGLRELAHGIGPDLSKLTNPETDGLRALMKLTEPLARTGMQVDSRARALRQYIRELIGGFDDQQHPRCKAALQAAFCLAPDVSDGQEFPSIKARLQVRARAGAFGRTFDLGEAQTSWETGVRRLAKLVEQNQDDLHLIGKWASHGSPSGYQPLRVLNLTVTYFLTGQVVTDVVTERRVVATEDDVNRYIVRDYVQGAPNAHIEVRPLLNCQAGTHTPVDLGPGFVAVKAEMLLPRTYRKGTGCNFATQVKRTGVAEATTWQEIQVTSHGIEQLTMRVQFDLSTALPARCWYFAAMPDLGRLDPPGAEEGRDLEISDYGYTEKLFGQGDAAAKYGIVWRW
jgi:hypothetical protein